MYEDEDFLLPASLLQVAMIDNLNAKRHERLENVFILVKED